MTGFALALVLLSAVAHASWNLLAKRAGAGLGFTWLFNAIAGLLCAPLAIALIVAERPTIGPLELTMMLGSGLLHLGYFLALSQGYRVGDLSLVYPLARGTGPMLATAAAIAIFGERPTPLALTGAALIAVGVFILTGDPRKLRGSGVGRSAAWALLTGLFIAAYTLWDKLAVGTVQIAPLLYFWGFIAATVVLLSPFVARRRDEVRTAWTAHRRELFGTSLLVPIAYVLVLTALAISPISYVAPAREIGILVGAIMGTRLLAEGEAGRRLAGAAAMVLGVVALAVG